ncbi:hypothetical protein [Bosea vestrisii]|uniref:Uncharacterized protein n=1 Tax=Bosea vestrisii TaxID=151416 RepID=A0ABW0HAX6_9HYPH
MEAFIGIPLILAFISAGMALLIAALWFSLAHFFHLPSIDQDTFMAIWLGIWSLSCIAVLTAFVIDEIRGR